MSPGRRRNHLIWIGPIVALAGAVSYFMVFARFPALRDFPWINLPLVALGAGLSAVAVWRAFWRPETFRGKLTAPVTFALSSLLAGLFAFYIFSISYSLPPPAEVSLNLDQAPDFVLESNSGGTVRLGDFRGRKVALIFYRGFW